uniref:RHH-type transcriptional regulator, rel operon repressor / antitoxin RelB n=1 Tax=Candidatus Kentrum sp. SD TaxID=2126332 RepID=A0A451BQW2_9GAMM|nr:MAG: RHH-type transcriptional regulator, rel operon repressor / antitoxin RelB [Candidatus Kentron sp. SD]VFK47846.1 MAG: RHH-type transcriptional regulator, rel operon repressor / antitoxin RelB [Candidatus Kentron sp. SD]VFK80678.1 MAG: RHH-type transcriptional regulator, rel operon repressor / antitoxin RelB [Candidatus Kentron sp. SD]
MHMTVSVHLPDELAYKLGEVAGATEDSVSFVVQTALENYFEEQEDSRIALDRLHDLADPVISMEEMRLEVGL